MADKQRETEKFVGCILSVKTKPGPYGDVQHIIGTVREIDVESAEQAIVLDQAMSNGAMLPDGYVLLSGKIADLQVMGKASEIQANLKSAYSRSDSNKPKDAGLIEEVQSSSIASPTVRGSLQVGKGNPENLTFINSIESGSNLNGNHANANSSSVALMNSIASAMADVAIRNNQSEKGVLSSVALAKSASGMTCNNQSDQDKDSNGHLIAKPKPRKLGNGIANGYSPLQKELSHGNHNEIHTVASATVEIPGKTSTNVSLSTKTTSSNDGNILLKTFGTLSTNSGLALNGQVLFNAVANSSKTSTVPAANLTPADNAPSPSKLSPQKPVTYDHKKLGVLSQFVNVNGTEDRQSAMAAPRTPKNKTTSNTQNDPRLTRSHGKGNGRQQQRHGETFESMTKDEMAEEFDFEGSNAQFEKLPVTATKLCAKLTKTPQFNSTDTTYLAERVVASVTVGDGVNSVKKFVTNTGVAVPSVPLATRSKILNLAHETGLTHSRVVEVMGRAVTQIVIPLLGDSYRLSPERQEDRPWVLVCTGPHWQGAIGIAAARILASLGVHTCVCAPKEELKLCSTEELLYSMSGELLTRKLKDLKDYQFDLVIMAMDDHLSRTLTLAPYAHWLKTAPVVFVDPPLISSSSYRQELDRVCGGTQMGRKIVIISPVLPIAYPSDSTVKIFLANLGIPNDIFEENDVVYKSPFGDKLLIQIFSSSPK